jgi:transposase
LHAGVDLSRRKLDVCLLSERSEHLDQLDSPPDVDALRTLAWRIDDVHGEPVDARLVHDTLEGEGWDVEIADAQKVKGRTPLACKTDKIDSMVLAVLSQRDLVPAIWLSDPSIREERELARFRLHPVKHKSALKNRIHSTLINFGPPCPVTDLFGIESRKLLERLDAPEPWRGNVTAALSFDRGPERPDRSGRPPAQGEPRRSPLHPALDERAGDRLGLGVHDRRRDRTDRTPRLAAEAHRLYRPLPASRPVGRL